MARRKKKHDPIVVKGKPVWLVPRGHPLPLVGAGLHQDPRTKRRRTRDARRRAAIEEQNE